MKIEHFAINVENPVAIRAWYVEHFGMTIVRQMDESPYTTFLADDSGIVMLEIYCNPADQVPDYRKMDPLLVHLAFVSLEPEKDKTKLMKAGAESVSEVRFDDGSHLVMLRDPWGFAIQLCKRGKPMLKNQ